MTDTCACGQPLHYQDPRCQRMMEAFVQQLGPTISVMIEGRTWLVQRHYIALHGLKAEDLVAGRLPFPEVNG